MAPEQAVGKASEVGPQSDVYSLGAILYEMLTGHPPFEGNSSVYVLRQLLIDEPVSVRDLRRDVPAALDAICLKCLEKSTARRYVTSAELADDLRRFLVGEPVRAPVQGPLRSFARAVGKTRRSIQFALALSGWILVFVALGLYFRAHKGGSNALAAWPAGDSESALVTDVRDALDLWHENAERLRDNPNVSEQMTALLARHVPKAGEVDRRGFDWHYAWRLCHPAESVGTLSRMASFKAHATDAYFVTFSRDGSRFATCGRDRTARVWDAKTGAPVCVCSGHTDDVNWVDFSPDQRWLATASDDHSVRVWDAATGKEQFQLLGHSSSVVAVRFNPMGDTLASGDHQGVLKLWSLSSKRLVKSVAAHQKRIQCLAWGASGHLLASIGNDNAIRLWEMPEMVFRFERQTTEGQCASFSPVGDLIACGGSGTIEIDDIHTGGRYATYSDHLGHIESIAFSPDGRQLASCDGRGVLRLWDLASRRGWNAAPVRDRAGDSKEPVGVGLWCVAYSPDGTRIATTARDGTVDIWDASVTPQWTTVTKNEPDQAAIPLAFYPDGKHLAIARRSAKAATERLQIWDVSSTRPALVHDLGGVSARAVCFSREGKELVVGAPGRVEIYDAKSGDRRSQIPLTANGVAKAVAFDGHGSLLVLEESNKKWAISLVRSRRPGRKFARSPIPFSRPPASMRAASQFRTMEICWQFVLPDLRRPLCSTGTRDFSRSPRGLGSGANAAYAGFAPVGQPAGRLRSTGGVELWDPRTAKDQAFLSGLGQIVGPLVFCAEGRLLIVVSQEQHAVQVWDVRRRTPLFTLPLPAEASSSRFISAASGFSRRQPDRLLDCRLEWQRRGLPLHRLCSGRASSRRFGTSSAPSNDVERTPRREPAAIQYRARLSSISWDQRSMPPARLCTSAKPCPRSQLATCRLRTP